jgi:hypothetical protein
VDKEKNITEALREVPFEFPVRSHRRSWENNIKIYLRRRMWGFLMN